MAAATAAGEKFHARASASQKTGNVHVQNIKLTTTLAEFQSWVDTAIAGRYYLNLVFHEVDNPDLIAYSKRDAATGDTVLVVCTVDPHEWREATVTLDLAALGMDWTSGFTVHDLLTDAEYQWGERNYVRLDPHTQPAHVFTVRQS